MRSLEYADCIPNFTTENWSKQVYIELESIHESMD